ncbi:MAG TPA: Na+/H+ antiporter NhaC family protein [Gemmatimonadales bacterium]|nr:Na+/H+ antiporter NhaC family protein [Gemmatimonadales bacterium]
MSVPGLRLPHPLVLLVGFVLAAAALTWVVPAGQYDRQEDPATGRQVVVPGTYRTVAPAPVSLTDALVDIPKGMADAASVIFLVFLVGAAWTVVERTGVFGTLLDELVARLRGHDTLVIPISCLVFATGGILIQMQEELIAFAPILLLLVARLGFNRVTAVAMSIGAAVVGAAFSPIDPFMVGIAQKVAGLPLLSASAFRIVFLIHALAIYIWYTMRYAARTQTAAVASTGQEAAAGASGWRMHTILALILGAFALFVVGVLRWEWDFDQMSALFFAMGIIVGLVGKLGLEGTAEAYVDGFKSMAYAAMIIGFARAIYVVMNQGHIVDTVVRGLFAPVAELPVTLTAFGMMVAHALLHIPVPSTSGQAVLTMPLLVPLSDLLGLSRQVTVLAYQFGVGLMDLVNPTNGALLAMVAAVGVRLEEWWKFAIPVVLLLTALATVALAAAIAIGLT